jgi:hypothetical protein
MNKLIQDLDKLSELIKESKKSNQRMLDILNQEIATSEHDEHEEFDKADINCKHCQDASDRAEAQWEASRDEGEEV